MAASRAMAACPPSRLTAQAPSMSVPEIFDRDRRRLRRDQRGEVIGGAAEMLRKMAGVARLAPAFVAPAFLDDRDDIDGASRAHRVDDNMLPVAEKDGDAVARDRGKRAKEIIG